MPARKTPQAVDVEVGKRIRAQRKILGMSQTDLAAALEIAFQQVQKYESGSNRVGASRLQQIATALHVTPAFFFPSVKGEQSDTPEVVGLVSTSGAAELLRAFAEIKSIAVRRAVVVLAESLRELD